MKINDKKAFWVAIYITVAVVLIMSFFGVVIFNVDWNEHMTPVLGYLGGGVFIMAVIGLAKLCTELIMDEVTRE